MEKYEVNKTLKEFGAAISDIKKALNLDALQIKYQQLNAKMQETNFWHNLETAKKVSKEASQIERRVAIITNLDERYHAILEWLGISAEGTEEWEILENDINALAKDIKEFEVEVLLNGLYDESNAILELHPGAGGTESQDWCDMLYRMYLKYSVKKGFKTEMIDYQAGEEAGIKSVTFLVKGENAYGYLKGEMGVHRLVRISPFDANARRHTSFVSLEVIPELNDSVDVEIKDEDLKIDVYRSSGAGGQSVNTTDSAVRVTHLPTGIVVTCQNERSQIKNKETALNILKSKLIQLEFKKQEAELKELKGEQKDIAWGSQIRSYVFHPYQMVKDHRTGFENSNVEAVMDGELDGFINAYLKELKS